MAHLEVEFSGKLHDARRNGRRGNDAESAAGLEAGIRPGKLRVIQRVESFDTELQVVPILIAKVVILEQ